MNYEIFNAELLFISTTFVSLFVIVDPFAVIPVYLTLSETMPRSERVAMRIKATLIAFAILVAFILGGMAIFNFFGISIPAFRIAGGLLLLKFGIEQLSGQRRRVNPEEAAESLQRDDPSVFPLATPLLAGPGAISTIVLLASASTSPIRTLSLIVTTVLVLGASYIMLKFAPVFYRIFGKTGLNLMTKIMGIILTAIAVQFIITGIKNAF